MNGHDTRTRTPAARGNEFNYHHVPGFTPAHYFAPSGDGNGAGACCEKRTGEQSDSEARDSHGRDSDGRNSHGRDNNGRESERYGGGQRESQAPVAATGHERAEAPFHNRGRILVVEDEPTVAGLITDVLSEEGYAIDTVLDSREALELTRTQTYDLVICDLRMPHLDGRGFYGELVRQDSPLTSRLLFVTATQWPCMPPNF